jgi:hypothetical protein
VMRKGLPEPVESELDSEKEVEFLYEERRY